jgi:hypothetical protein
VLQAAHLKIADKVAFLQHYGERYLTLYPQSEVLLSYVREFLAWLRTADLVLFKGREPSLTEKLLWFLYNCSRPDHPASLPFEPEFLHDWYVLASFVREPALLGQKPEQVAESVGRLLNLQILLQPTSTQLIKELAEACLANEKQVLTLTTTLRRTLTPTNLLPLLYELAEKANTGIRQRRYAKTLLAPCLQVAADFQFVFPEESRQEIFVQSFLDTLLEGFDADIRIWLSNSKAWPSDLSARWRNYVSQQAFLTIADPSWVEHCDLWLESEVAFRKVRSALASRDEQELIEVGTDYMTTLTSYRSDNPNEAKKSWNRFDRALDSFDQVQKERKWYRIDPSKLQPQAPAQAGMLSPAQLGKKRFTPAWWERRDAFIQMKKALSQENIGKIVRVATQYGSTLAMYPEDIPQDWRVQVQAAVEFFRAWRKADKHRDETREQALVDAGNKISEMVKMGYSAPLFTTHELRRILQARHYLAQQEAQRTSSMSRQEVLAILLEALQSVSQQILQPPTSATPKKHWWKFWG